MPMIERLMIRRLNEDEDDENAKSEFRRKIMRGAKKFIEDNCNSNSQLVIQNPSDLSSVGLGA